jgi:hypothetical protein
MLSAVGSLDAGRPSSTRTSLGDSTPARRAPAQTPKPRPHGAACWVSSRALLGVPFLEKLAEFERVKIKLLLKALEPRLNVIEAIREPVVIGPAVRNIGHLRGSSVNEHEGGGDGTMRTRLAGASLQLIGL